MKHLVTGIMLFSFLGLFSCKAQNVNNLTVEAFAEALSPETCILDVRTAAEFEAGHLRGAENIDWFHAGFVDSVKARCGQDQPLYLYCRSGKRSAAAAEKLAKAGYTVYNLLGGYLAWTEAGREVTRYEVERFRTPRGAVVEITLVKHASLEIRFKGLSIQVDPVAELGKKTDYAKEFPKADYILVTHEHFDHFDQAAIDALRKDGTVLITNNRCAQMTGWGKALANGDSLQLAFDMEAVPAYNITERLCAHAGRPAHLHRRRHGRHSGNGCAERHRPGFPALQPTVYHDGGAVRPCCANDSAQGAYPVSLWQYGPERPARATARDGRPPARAPVINGSPDTAAPY